MDFTNADRSTGGVSASSKLSESRRDTPKDDEPKSDAGFSSSYAISSHGETTDLREGLALRPHRKRSTSIGKSTSSRGDREDQGEKSKQDQSALGEDRAPSDDKSTPGEHGSGPDNNGTKNETKVMKEYSAEARLYHAYYDELQRAHMRGHYTWCRDNCLNMLSYPRIPMWTRIQTLQLLSTMLAPAGGEQCLHDADQLIDKLDPNEFQTELLREDNRKMKADRMEWRIKHDMVGKDIEGVGEDGKIAGEGPSDGELKLDRELDEKLRRDLEEMEQSRKPEVKDG